MWPKALPPSCPGMRPKRDVECCLINILTRKHKLGIFQRCHSPLYSGGHPDNQPVAAAVHCAPNTEPFSEIYCLIVTFDQLLSTVNFQLILTPPPTPSTAGLWCLVNLDVDLNQPWTKSSTVQITTDIKSSWHFSFLAVKSFVCIFVFTNPIHIRINDRVLCLLHISTQIFR